MPNPHNGEGGEKYSDGCSPADNAGKGHTFLPGCEKYAPNAGLGSPKSTESNERPDIHAALEQVDKQVGRAAERLGSTEDWSERFDEEFVNIGRGYVKYWWKVPISGQPEIASPLEVKVWIEKEIYQAQREARESALREVRECVPEKANREGESLNPEHQSKINTWCHGFNDCREEMLSRLSKLT